MAQYMESYLSLEDAANNAVRYAAVHPTEPEKTIEIARKNVKSRFVKGDEVSVEIVYDEQSPCSERTIKVTLQSQLQPTTPFLGMLLSDGRLTVRASSAAKTLVACGGQS